MVRGTVRTDFEVLPDSAEPGTIRMISNHEPHVSETVVPDDELLDHPRPGRSSGTS